LIRPLWAEFFADVNAKTLLKCFKLADRQPTVGRHRPFDLLIPFNSFNTALT
jgi:hypothetical protein